MNSDLAMESSTSDLPFLVTHWLSNAIPSRNRCSLRTPNDLDGNDDNETEKQDAIDRIRNATRELADAFADLGMFGAAFNNPLGVSSVGAVTNVVVGSSSNLRNASYSDVARRWDGLPSGHLESLVGSSSSVTAAVVNSRTESSSILDAAYDRSIGGTEVSQSQFLQQDVLVPSILQKPVQLLRGGEETSNNAVKEISTNADSSSTMRQPNDSNKAIPSPVEMKLVVGSDSNRVECLSAQASRRYLTIRAIFEEEKRTIQQMKRSLAYQKHIKVELDDETTTLLSTHCAGVGSSAVEVKDDQLSTSDCLAQKKLENDRIIAQLGRKLEEIQNLHYGVTDKELTMASSVSDALWKESVSMMNTFMDPSFITKTSYHNNSKLHGHKTNSILSHVTGRSYGVGIRQRKGALRQRIGINSSDLSIKQRSKALISHRLAHVITINAHLFCPVYCLRFDRTGRFFVTGADDNLVKLFRIGSTVKSNNTEKQKYDSRNRGYSYQQGAVLVCTLRGHASVITDIDVSADNALLATASEDGDVRVWGMADGCPVAILRGHEGGANMVSWSCVTPYQLVSIADDGLARMWDVREAALKRCKIIRKRRDYILSELQKEITEKKNAVEHQGVPTNEDNEHTPALNSTLQNTEHGEQESSGEQQQIQNGAIFVPPLPPGAEFGIGFEMSNNNVNGTSAPGTFVANNEIDEGVSLLSRLQHGELIENTQLQGAGTRSRRKKVKVLCLSRCPIGGHFATGSDDGIGRVWLDDSNKMIDKLDEKSRHDSDAHFYFAPATIFPNQITDSLQRTRSASIENKNAPSTRTLLASLHGHHNEITDIQYSSLGDRLITASQKDGVVRVWSWGDEASKGTDGLSKMDQIKQIFIRLEPPQRLVQQRKNSSNEIGGSTSRRRQRNSSQNSSLHTQCDVASWTADDTKIITSQSCVAKQTDTDIIPGSHLIYVWDSKTGNCLIGLPEAHEKPCPVLSSHPLDSSIIVSAGADGFVKIWDLGQGKCIFSHQNTHEYGALENLADRGKVCGYLDGSFSPDGLYLVLTDDTGRITIIDVLSPEKSVKNKSATLSRGSNGVIVLDDDGDTDPPTWMQEQYFANDYYDLFYDANGYCIERGSRLPPHLSPEAARCMHTGHAHTDSVQQAFAEIEGPMPLNETVVFTERETIRRKSTLVRKSDGVLIQNVAGKRNLIEARATQLSHVGNAAKFPFPARHDHQFLPSNSPVGRPVEAAGPERRNMSNRYRWIGFEEMEREVNDDDEAETDDEEYEEGNRIQDDEFEEEPLGLDDFSPRADRRRNRNTTQRSQNRRNRNTDRSRGDDIIEVNQNEPTRVSARQFSRRADNQYVYESDESDFEELLTANTSPTGEFKGDYTELGHIYKLPYGGSVNRKWVTREECVLGYTGWKTYCPQEGDEIVYIPKAHSETLRVFPVCETATGAPWKSWPRSAPWPLVVCTVKKIRFRFPYSGYFGSRSRNPINSVTAILTLELTGVPHTSNERTMPWVAPIFSPLPSTNLFGTTFEVTIFENGESDFVVPLELFKWRMQSLERAIEENGDAKGVMLTDFYVNDEDEDSKVDPFSCKLLSTVPHDENEFHFQGSGYNSIHIKYEMDDDNLANAWDVTVNGTEKNCPLPTCLTDDQEKAAIEIFDELESDFYVKATFSSPVNERSFVDYSMMIEAPIDISTIRRRLNKKYYTNVLSVKADMRLLRDNCLKYNKMGSEITEEVQKLFAKFSTLFADKLNNIGDEPSKRGGSIELDLAVSTISSVHFNSSADVSSADNASRSSVNGNSIANRRSDRSRRQRARSEIVLPGMPIRPPNVPRIRIPSQRTRRRQDYLPEPDSVEHTNNSNENEEIMETDLKLKVFIGGEEYHESLTSDEESISVDANHTDLHHKRNTRSRRPVSNSDNDSNSALEDTERRSIRQNGGATPAQLAGPESLRHKRSLRRTAKVEEEDEFIPDIPDTVLGMRRSTRGASKIESQDEESSRDDSSPDKSSETRRSTRRAGKISVQDESSQDGSRKIESPRIRRSTRKTGKYAAQDEFHDESSSASEDGKGIDSEESGDDEDETQIASRQKGRRSTRSATMVSVPTRDTSQSNRNSPRRRSQNQVQSLQEAFTRRITASSTRVTRSRHFAPSVLESELPNTNRQAELRSSRVPSSTLENLPASSPGRTRSSSRSRRNTSSYEDFSNSDYNDDEDGESNSDDETVCSGRRLRKRAPLSPSKISPPKRRPKKKRRIDEVRYPQLDKWPGHIVKPNIMIEVCEEILDRVETFDAEGLFHIPVTEQYPEVAESYNQKVETPMDLKTIRTERMEGYRVISELQDDLILICRNCCAFNKVRSQYWKYAVEIWEHLNQIFIDTLKEKCLDLPRRFTR